MQRMEDRPGTAPPASFSRLGVGLGLMECPRLCLATTSSQDLGLSLLHHHSQACLQRLSPSHPCCSAGGDRLLLRALGLWLASGKTGLGVFSPNSQGHCWESQTRPCLSPPHPGHTLVCRTDGPAAEGACHAEGSWQQPAARRLPQPTPPHTARSAEPGKLGQWLQGPVGCRPPLQGSPSLWVPGKPWSKVEMVTNIVD